MTFTTVIRSWNRWIYWIWTSLGLVMPNLLLPKINKKSGIIIILSGGHLLCPPGSFTLSLSSWLMCEMKDISLLFKISKDLGPSLSYYLIYKQMNLSDLNKMYSWMRFRAHFHWSYPYIKSTPLPWLGVFKYIIQCYCPDWRHLNM